MLQLNFFNLKLSRTTTNLKYFKIIENKFKEKYEGKIDKIII